VEGRVVEVQTEEDREPADKAGPGSPEEAGPGSPEEVEVAGSLVEEVAVGRQGQQAAGHMAQADLEISDIQQ